jgi:hypothetical protein
MRLSPLLVEQIAFALTGILVGVVALPPHAGIPINPLSTGYTEHSAVLPILGDL